MGPDAMILVFWLLSFKPTFSLSSFTFITLVLLRFLPWRWCHLCIWGYWYFSLQSWFQLVLHRAWHVAWCTLHKLNKQGDNKQPWRTPFLIWNQPVVTHPALTVVSWPAYRFLSNFQAHNTVLLTRVTVLYTGSPWLIFFIIVRLYLLTPFTHFCENLWFWFHDLRETRLMIRSVWING